MIPARLNDISRSGRPVRSRSTNLGLTLMETLFVVVIITAAVAIIMVSYSKLNAAQALDKSADLVVAILDEARTQTLSSKGDAQYGVHFDSASVVLFRGDTYSSSDPTNTVNALHALVNLRNINFTGGGADVVFERLTGDTSSVGTLELFLKNATTTFRTITIGGTGIVELN